MIATVYTGMGPQQNSESDGEEGLVVVASFFPLYDFASHVAGDRAEVSSLVPAGIEPHDWEPTLGEASTGRSADLLVINGAGFESWADNIGARIIVNTSNGLELERDDDGRDGGVNPHIWLDPIFAKHQVEKIRDALMAADPENAGHYDENANNFAAELDSLDAFIRTELSDCEKSDFIAFHDAFAHFAQRYGLVQHSVHGASPEGEILAQRIEQLVRLANDLDINVIYSEDLIDSGPAETIANEIPGGKVLVLSPIEGIDRDEQDVGIGYIEKMKQNVANLKEGLGCS
jgi:zinc transport system substrate-binding protein